MFKNMGGNIPGGNLMGGNFPGGSFPDTTENIFVEDHFFLTSKIFFLKMFIEDNLQRLKCDH